MVARILLVLGLSSLVGCEKPPVYNQIMKITVHQQTGGSGTQRSELSGEQLERARACLLNHTQEITEEVYKQDLNDLELIQSIVVIQVVDRNGDRMFEFTTPHDFKGNKGKYYRNRCIYQIVRNS